MLVAAQSTCGTFEPRHVGSNPACRPCYAYILHIAAFCYAFDVSCDAHQYQTKEADPTCSQIALPLKIKARTVAEPQVLPSALPVQLQMYISQTGADVTSKVLKQGEHCTTAYMKTAAVQHFHCTQFRQSVAGVALETGKGHVQHGQACCVRHKVGQCAYLDVWQQPHCKLCCSCCHASKDISPLVYRQIWGNALVCPAV